MHGIERRDGCKKTFEFSGDYPLLTLSDWLLNDLFTLQNMDLWVHFNTGTKSIMVPFHSKCLDENELTLAHAVIQKDFIQDITLSKSTDGILHRLTFRLTAAPRLSQKLLQEKIEHVRTVSILLNKLWIGPEKINQILSVLKLWVRSDDSVFVRLTDFLVDISRRSSNILMTK